MQRCGRRKTCRIVSCFLKSYWKSREYLIHHKILIMQPAIESGILDELLGQTLVKRGLITQTQLDMALFVQKHWDSEYLGEVLQYLGVSQDKINKTLNHLNKRRKIGEILVVLGFISPEELERALGFYLSVIFKNCDWMR